MTWPLRSLGDVALVQGGRTPRKLDAYLADHPRSDRSVPFYKVGDMNAGPTLSTARTLVASDELQSLGIVSVPRGTLVFPKAGGAIATNKKRSVTVPGPVDLNCMAVTAGPDLDPQYLRLWFESFDLTSITDGSVLPQISKRRASELQIPLPPLDEQRRVVDLLEDHLSRLDVAQELMRRNDVRAVVMQEAWLKSALDHQQGGSWLRVGDVLESVKGGWSRSAHHLVGIGDGVPYLKMNNLTRRGRLDLREVVRVEADDDTLLKYGVRAGDLLFNSKNSGDLIGKTALADSRVAGSVINENIMRLRFDTRVVPEFAVVWFLGPQMRRCITDAASASTNVAAVYQKNLVTFPIWVPTPEMQQRLAAEFDAIRLGAERLQSELAAAHRRAGPLRRALLAAAFSGRLTGTESDLSAAEEMIGA